MPDLLFEIGVEELPALSIEPAIAFMKKHLEDVLRDSRLQHKTIETFGTPRRLVVIVEDIAEKQADLKEEIMGPSVALAFLPDGKSLSKAGYGFIKAKDLDEKQIFKKKTDKGEVIAAEKIETGRYAKDILPALLLDMMHKIPFKKRMRWDSSGDTFSRPVRSLLCLFGKDYLDVSFADVQSSNWSRGHRFMNPDPFVVISSEQYLQEMKNRHVVLSGEEREAMFVHDAKKLLEKIGASFRYDEDLMAIVKNLVEYPFVILGSFEKKYLDIPSEILISEMKTHQKCFAVFDDTGSMLPYFICGAGTKPYDDSVFAKGNARVLRARFEDGAFYFAEDIKKKLSEHKLGLANLVFERDLGTVAEKSVRIENVALKLASFLGFSDDDISFVKRAAPLLKADLVTGVVGQFPELEGIMGRIYAKHDGEKDEVCECIETHYWPKNAYDQLPRLKIAAVLSIADKLDTLVGIIGIGKKPSGNKDPFALRRNALAIIRMLIHFGFNIDQDDLIKISLQSYGDRFTKDNEKLLADVKEFIVQRARGLLIDELGKENKDAANFADSVLSVGKNNLLDAFARAHTLYAMHNKSKEEFLSVVQTFKRASNIVKKAKDSGELFEESRGFEGVLSEAEEKELLSAVNNAKNLIKAQEKIALGFSGLQSSYSQLFSQVVVIKPKLDAFFDHVMVMVDDKNVRHARLNLLREIKTFADRIADFTHL